MKANYKKTKETEVNEEDAPDSPTNDVTINYNYDDEKNDYEVTPDTSTNGRNNETIENSEDKNDEEEAEKETGNENLNMKANDRETEETGVNEEDEEDEVNDVRIFNMWYVPPILFCVYPRNINVIS